MRRERTPLTGVVCAFVVFARELRRIRHASQLTKSVVGDFENPATVDHTVGRLEVSVTLDWTVV